ncbi:MAG: beta-propeller fold lactonase family protein [Candidatus Rokuibacteriota bacterium]
MPGVPSSQEELVVANSGTATVTVYGRTITGNTAPLRTIAGAATGMSAPRGVALDLVRDELLVANTLTSSITVYPRTASGNAAPLRTLAGGATGLNTPGGLALNLRDDELVVANQDGNSITVHARTASGNTAPLRTITGGLTGLNGPRGVVLDLTNDELVVANGNANSVTVYSRTASGNVAPLRTISGLATGLNAPRGVALDLVRDEIVVTNGSGDSVTVYSRTASGNTAPLRTLTGNATQLSAPEGVVLDLVNDELLIVNAFGPSVTVYPRAASGNTAPRRTVAGAGTGLALPQAAALSTSPPLAAAVLPLSRSDQTGALLTAFATIINAGPGPVQQCHVLPPASPPAGLGPVVFQTTDPKTNLPTGMLSTPAHIAAGGSQTFVFGFSPAGVIPETSLAMNFVCENTVGAARIEGVNNLILTADIAAVPDTIALMATTSGDGVVRVPGAIGLQLFATATSNVGATGIITVSADTGDVALPVSLTVCETNSSTGACLAPPAPTVTVNYAAATARSFAFFAQASGAIAFDPAVNRVFVRLRDSGGVTRGATSAALCTTSSTGC